MWIDESQTVRPNLDHGRPTATIAAKEEEDPLGILHEGERHVIFCKVKCISLSSGILAHDLVVNLPDHSII